MNDIQKELIKRAESFKSAVKVEDYNEANEILTSLKEINYQAQDSDRLKEMLGTKGELNLIRREMLQQ